MADKREKTDRDTEDGPHQTIRRMAADDEGDGVGPFFPSGMSAPEAAVAGADIPEQQEQEEPA